jgi:hypothetical protein
MKIVLFFVKITVAYYLVLLLVLIITTRQCWTYLFVGINDSALQNDLMLPFSPFLQAIAVKAAIAFAPVSCSWQVYLTGS